MEFWNALFGRRKWMIKSGEDVDATTQRGCCVECANPPKRFTGFMESSCQTGTRSSLRGQATRLLLVGPPRPSDVRDEGSLRPTESERHYSVARTLLGTHGLSIGRRCDAIDRPAVAAVASVAARPTKW